MAIKKEKPMIATNETEVLEAIGIELNNTAVSIGSTGLHKYAVIKIKFDAKSGVAGSVEVVQADLDFYEAQHRFKVLTVEEGLFN